MSIRLGVVGAGGIGRVHTQAAKRNGVVVACIADVNEASAKALAEAEGVPEATTDATQIFADKGIDAVAIGVPNKFHKDLAIAALEAGKDVLLEKPMAMNVAECRAINEAAERHGRIVQIGFVNRYSSASQAGKRFVEAGRLGDVYHAQANLYRARGIPGLGGWFTTKAISGGGVLIDIGVHAIDLAMHLMDFPNVKAVSGKVYATFGTRMKDYVYENMWAEPAEIKGTCDVDDAAHAMVRLDNGATLEVNVTWAANFSPGTVKNGITLFGDRGGMTMQLGGSELQIATEEHGHNVDLQPRVRPVNAWDAQYQAFIEAVRERTPPAANGEQGMIVQGIIDAIYRSSEEDREVEFAL